jgi:hypothetical protein
MHRGTRRDLAVTKRTLMLEIARRTRFSSRPQLGAISSSRCQKTRAPHPRHANKVASGRTTQIPIAIRWWSQTGSNRRPPACKAGALPAELWPRSAERVFSRFRKRRLACRAVARGSTRPPSPHSASKTRVNALSGLRRGSLRSLRERRLVGLGRLELPTSRLSSARSNQLSYKPGFRIA